MINTLYILDAKLSELRNAKIQSISDIDNADILIHMRHIYLACAKEFIRSGSEGEREFGLMLCGVAEHIHSAIELLTGTAPTEETIH